tara:strand:- start:1998 stop:3011 length:1014 start_codon:yes stop_codon:yes gene_type:complete
MLRFITYFREAVEMKNPFNPLKITDLVKDENRVLTFIKKVEQGEPFITVKRGDFIIPRKFADEVKSFMTAGEKGKFPVKGSSMVVAGLKIPSDFLKTGEFGGRGQGSGTNAEVQAMNYFNDNLNKILKQESVPYITLKINGRKVECMTMVQSTGKYKGAEPKSDFSILDHKMNPVAFISHKAGTSAKSYQQYGGVSKQALPSKYENHPEIKKFMQDVKKLQPKGLESGQSFYRSIKDNNLIGLMKYGPEYGSKTSIHNVDEFHLGNMNLIGRGQGPYTIKAVESGTNGKMPKGQSEAVLFIRYQARRGDARAAGEVVPNARVGVFPLAKTSRTSKKI